MHKQLLGLFIIIATASCSSMELEETKKKISATIENMLLPHLPIFDRITTQNPYPKSNDVINALQQETTNLINQIKPHLTKPEEEALAILDAYFCAGHYNNCLQNPIESAIRSIAPLYNLMACITDALPQLQRDCSALITSIENELLNFNINPKCINIYIAPGDVPILSKTMLLEFKDSVSRATTNAGIYVDLPRFSSLSEQYKKMHILEHVSSIKNGYYLYQSTLQRCKHASSNSQLFNSFYKHVELCNTVFFLLNKNNFSLGAQTILAINKNDNKIEDETLKVTRLAWLAFIKNRVTL